MHQGPDDPGEADLRMTPDYWMRRLWELEGGWQPHTPSSELTWLVDPSARIICQIYIVQVFLAAETQSHPSDLGP